MHISLRSFSVVFRNLYVEAPPRLPDRSVRGVVGDFALIIDVSFFDWAVLVAPARLLAARRQRRRGAIISSIFNICRPPRVLFPVGFIWAGARHRHDFLWDRSVFVGGDEGADVMVVGGEATDVMVVGGEADVMVVGGEAADVIIVGGEADVIMLNSGVHVHPVCSRSRKEHDEIKNSGRNLE